MTRVVGAREVENLPVGASLTVPRDAVITPLARDLIREKRIKLAQAEAEAQISARRRAVEQAMAEESLEQLMPAPDRPAESASSNSDTSHSPDSEPTTTNEVAVSRIVEEAVKQVVASGLLDRVEAPNTLKFAVLGSEVGPILRAVTEAAEKPQATVERLSGRRVEGLFVLAVAMSHGAGSAQNLEDEIRATLANHRLLVVFA